MQLIIEEGSVRALESRCNFSSKKANNITNRRAYEEAVIIALGDSECFPRTIPTTNAKLCIARRRSC